MNFERSGKPSTSATNEKQEEAKAIILAEKRVTTEEIALQRQGTAFSLVSDILGFHKVSACWLPKHLTEDHKRSRVHICSSLLERYNIEGVDFLNHIITGDEIWTHLDEPETEGQSMQWKHTSIPSSKKITFQTLPASSC